MGPDHETNEADRYQGISHAEITEDRFAREGRDDLADHPEAAQDHDVHFGMAEKPEQVLEENRISTVCCIEERSAEVAISQEHRDGAGQHRQ